MLAQNRIRLLLGFLSLLVTLGILLCTLWPFNPFPRNNVAWLPASDGIRFDGNGVILSQVPLNPDNSASLNEPASLELSLNPFDTQHVYTVLDFYQPDNPFHFRVRQYLDGLIVSKDFRTPNGKLGHSKIDIEHCLLRGKTSVITLTSSEKGSAYYWDGTLKATYPNFKFTLNDLSGQIILGTAPIDAQPWLGEIHGLALYTTELRPAGLLVTPLNEEKSGELQAPDQQRTVARYRFRGGRGSSIHSSGGHAPDLLIPAHFQVPHQAFLRAPWEEFHANWDYVADVVRNVLGFVPLGFFLCAYLMILMPQKRALLISIVFGCALSLGIEIIQAYLPQRVSGVTDIITNTLGTGLGALLLLRASPRRFLRALTAEEPTLRLSKIPKE